MLKRTLKFLLRLILISSTLVLLGIILPRLITLIYSANRIYQKSDAPNKRLAIVFGAGLKRDGTPTTILRDRVETAASLYFDQKVEKILMSGDNRFEDYNEPEAMRQYAISSGVPADAIVLDYAGRRTYDTCYRAKAIFGATEGFANHTEIPSSQSFISMQWSGTKSRWGGGKQPSVLARIFDHLEYPRADGYIWCFSGSVCKFSHACFGEPGANICGLTALPIRFLSAILDHI